MGSTAHKPTVKPRSLQRRFRRAADVGRCPGRRDLPYGLPPARRKKRGAGDFSAIDDEALRRIGAGQSLSADLHSRFFAAQRGFAPRSRPHERPSQRPQGLYLEMPVAPAVFPHAKFWDSRYSLHQSDAQGTLVFFSLDAAPTALGKHIWPRSSSSPVNRLHFAAGAGFSFRSSSSTSTATPVAGISSFSVQSTPCVTSRRYASFRQLP